MPLNIFLNVPMATNLKSREKLRKASKTKVRLSMQMGLSNCYQKSTINTLKK